MADGSSPQRKPRVDAAARRAEYVDVAARVMLEKGLHGATMRDFAEAAGAAKILFYRLFPSRDALVDAVYDRVETAVLAAYAEPWTGYGSMVRRVLETARHDPAPFLVVFRNCGGGADRSDWGDRLRAIFNQRSRPLFEPKPGAPPGAEARADLAGGSLFGLFVDSMIVWLEERDGLDDAARIQWWGHIVRAWHLASREAFRLDPPKGGAEE
ncbi:MAG: TetR family transcriptional regulator [Caulobacter sp.]|nr:TetR family transcriptional regulator [Caulobacter sp.]